MLCIKLKNLDIKILSRQNKKKDWIKFEWTFDVKRYIENLDSVKLNAKETSNWSLMTAQHSKD